MHARTTFIDVRFAGQAAATPGALAVVAGPTSVTYGVLESRANQLANHLRSLGVDPDVVVGLCTKRSVAMVVGALGILKAGGAYLPMDPDYPAQRLSFILKQAEAQAIVTTADVRDVLSGADCPLIELDSEGRLKTAQSSKAPSVTVSCENLAYVIYTSGSTGQPKGVEVTHGNLLNLIFWHQRALGVTPADRATQLASVGFDAAVWELWPYLTTGASIHVPDEIVAKDSEALRDWLVSERITISFVSTPLAERLLNLDWPKDTALRTLLTGADRLHRYPPCNLPFQLVNNYGPTECTVVATSGPVAPDYRPDRLPPIGLPIDNASIYILDEQRRPVSAGTTGEIYVGGLGVARGYRNCPDLTNQKFMPDPFRSGPGARMYRTGDLGRYLPDGQVAFIGRADDQIKIRGFRIEPNEIVAALNECPGVLQSTVAVLPSSPGNQRLVAYVVPNSDASLCHSHLRKAVSARLPEHMVPSTFVQLEEFPLTPNGKIDSTALPSPTAANTLRDDTFVAPRTPIEERVASILAPLLGLEQVGVQDNFFLLGGHSLLGTQLIARIREAFGVDFSLRTVFDSPTVEELSAQVEQLLLARLESMSEDEAQRILGAAAQADSEGSLA